MDLNAGDRAVRRGVDPDAYRRHSPVMGIVLLVLGALAILLPLFAGAVVTAILGWLLVLAAFAHWAFAFAARGTGAVAWQTLIGLVYLLVGLYLVLHPARALVTLTILLASYFVIEGVLEIVSYFQLKRRAHLAGWTLWNGVITLILGVLIWAQWPFSSAWAVGSLLGISLLMSGIARLTFRSGTVPLVGAA